MEAEIVWGKDLQLSVAMIVTVADFVLTLFWCIYFSYHFFKGAIPKNLNKFLNPQRKSRESFVSMMDTDTFALRGVFGDGSNPSLRIPETPLAAGSSTNPTSARRSRDPQQPLPKDGIVAVGEMMGVESEILRRLCIFLSSSMLCTKK